MGPKAQHEIMGPVEPYGDLLAKETSYRLVLADKVDRKELSSDQADELFAEYYSGLETEARNRDATRAQASWPAQPFPTMPPQPAF